MTEYWVSRGKHYCKMCRVWVQNDKASIAHHEAGRKHKETVEEHLKATRKLAREEKRVWPPSPRARGRDGWGKPWGMCGALLTCTWPAQEKDELHKELAAIEKAARDQYNEVDRPGAHVDSSTEGPSRRGPRPPGRYWTGPRDATRPGPLAGGVDPSLPSANGWVQGHLTDGTVYYWHAETNMSQWHPPPHWPFPVPGGQGTGPAAPGATQPALVSGAPASAPAWAHVPPEVDAPAGAPPPAQSAPEEGEWRVVSVRELPDSDTEDKGGDEAPASAEGGRREAWAALAEEFNAATGDDAQADDELMLEGSHLVDRVREVCPSAAHAAEAAGQAMAVAPEAAVVAFKKRRVTAKEKGAGFRRR